MLKWERRDYDEAWAKAGDFEMADGINGAIAPPATAGEATPACTCGSGAHPRRCAAHPDAYDRHVAEINAEWQGTCTATEGCGEPKEPGSSWCAKHLREGAERERRALKHLRAANATPRPAGGQSEGEGRERGGR